MSLGAALWNQVKEEPEAEEEAQDDKAGKCFKAI
jgi:hypothetical protein